jgi:hypothetical protein
MSTVTWITVAIGFAGFVCGYLLRSYVSYRRRKRARRARYELATKHRIFAPAAEPEAAQPTSAESVPLVPADPA